MRDRERERERDSKFHYERIEVFGKCVFTHLSLPIYIPRERERERACMHVYVRELERELCLFSKPVTNSSMFELHTVDINNLNM